MTYDDYGGGLGTTTRELRRNVATPDLRDTILRVRELPTLPSVLVRILKTAADPESSAVELGELMSDDQSLSATLLKLVNSAYYGFEHSIESTTRAIVVLGFFEVRNITLTTTAFRTFRGKSSSFSRLLLWRHAIASAIAAELTAKAAQTPLLGCFESGLLHDIGKVVLDVLYPNRFREAAEKASTEQRRLTELETELFGADHAWVGGLLVEHWNLPPTIVQAVRHHHTPEEAEDNGRLARIAAIANYITYGADLGEPSNGRPPGFPEAAGQELGLSQEQCAEISQKVAGVREEIDAFLGVLID